MGKAIVASDIRDWNSDGPSPGNFAFFGGFPELTHGVTPDNNFAIAPYFAVTPVTSVTDHQITCRFDRDKMIDFSGSGLPPQGYNVSGVSGGPLLIPTLSDEGLVWRFVGVIVEAARGEMFEQVVAVRSQYVQLDGRIG